jgi:voltage-gated potassium channel
MKYTFDFIHVFFVDLGYAGPILIFLIVCISLMGLIIGRNEGWSRFDALYHAFINATTVGYGDLYPKKKISKALSVAIAVVGLIFTGILIAIGIHAANQAFNNAYESSERSYRVEK